MRISRTEARSMVLATGLLLLGVVARLGLGPGPTDVGWAPGSVAGRSASELDSVQIRVEERLAAAERASRPLGPEERIDPNTASVSELQRLPGIGPSKAASIEAYRRRNGAFLHLDDLTRVPGIGPSTVSPLSPHVTLRRLSAAPNQTAETVAGGRNALRVNVNRAQINELEQITGIGPTLASRIAETRRRIGKFRGPEDLLLVPGIGPAVLREIRDQVRF